MPTCGIFPVEVPASPTLLDAYRTLRLTSLQTDPHAFTSTFAYEATFTEAIWREKLDAPFKQILIASVSDAGDALSHRCDDNTGDKPAVEPPGKWIGTATVLAPSSLRPAILGAFKEAGVADNWEIYAIYSMWVHPAHRGKGVGASLIKACLEWARANVDLEFSTGNLEKVVVLDVFKDNVAGRAFYCRSGFIDLETVPAAKGEIWMMTKV